MTARLDHGLLNVPLSERGNIDAQIDRYKAEQARKERDTSTALRNEYQIEKARLRALIDRLSDERAMALAKPMGSRTPRTARQALFRIASTSAKRWIAVLERELDGASA